MGNFSFDTSAFLKSLDFTKSEVRAGAERGMNDVVDDLTRVSSEIAPHDKGTLEKAYTRDVTWNGDQITGEVTYSAKENGFDYALWTHEADYNLGEGSRLKPGTEGMSGRHYDVGNKYVERPLKGEADVYKAHIAAEIRKGLGG